MDYCCSSRFLSLRCKHEFPLCFTFKTHTTYTRSSTHSHPFSHTPSTTQTGDRALYVSVRDQQPFLRLANFHRPYQGFDQAMVQRTVSAGLYFALQGTFEATLDLVAAVSEIVCHLGERKKLNDFLRGGQKFVAAVSEIENGGE